MKKYDKKIIELLEKFDWMFQTTYHDKKISIMKEDEDGKMAEIVYVQEYQQIEVRVYPLFFKHSKGEQRKALLHEMCHVINAPSKRISSELLEGKLITPEQIRMANEEATSKIENLLDRLLTGGLGYAKQAYKKYLQ